MLIQYIAGALTVAAEHVTRREIIIGACCYIWNNSCGPIMMTSSNENIFRVTGHLCGEFTGDRWIPRTKASDAELWCFLWFAPEQTVKLNSKQWWGWWFETPSCPLWRHCNAAGKNPLTSGHSCHHFKLLQEAALYLWVLCGGARGINRRQTSYYCVGAPPNWE